MSLRLTPIQERLLAVLLLLVGLALLVGLIAVPTWWLHARYDQAIEDSLDRLKRYQRVAALRPSIDETIKLVEEKGARKRYLHGASQTLAGAELQRLVTQLVEKNNGRIASSQVMPSKDGVQKGAAAKILLSVQLNASIVPLQLILHALETNEPSLFIEQFTVRSSQGRNYKPVPGTQPEFAVQMTIAAYALPEGVSP